MPTPPPRRRKAEETRDGREDRSSSSRSAARSAAGPTSAQTLIGLGLNKLRRRSTLKDTPAVRGMIAKVHHLVRVVDER